MNLANLQSDFGAALRQAEDAAKSALGGFIGSSLEGAGSQIKENYVPQVNKPETSKVNLNPQLQTYAFTGLAILVGFLLLRKKVKA